MHQKLLLQLQCLLTQQAKVLKLDCLTWLPELAARLISWCVVQYFSAPDFSALKVISILDANSRT